MTDTNQFKEVDERFDEKFHLTAFGNLSDGQMYSKKELPDLVKSFLHTELLEERKRVLGDLTHELQMILTNWSAGENQVVTMLALQGITDRIKASITKQLEK